MTRETIDVSADCRRHARQFAKTFFPLDDGQAGRLAEFIGEMLAGELPAAVEREVARRSNGAGEEQGVATKGGVPWWTEDWP